MKTGNGISDQQLRRMQARRTALIVGAIAIGIYVMAIVSVVRAR
jgi:hypothetical protein